MLPFQENIKTAAFCCVNVSCAETRSLPVKLRYSSSSRQSRPNRHTEAALLLCLTITSGLFVSSSSNSKHFALESPLIAEIKHIFRIVFAVRASLFSLHPLVTGASSATSSRNNNSQNHSIFVIHKRRGRDHQNSNASSIAL